MFISFALEYHQNFVIPEQLRLHLILNRTLAELGELPVRQMTEMTFAEDEETIYFHDGTERPIPRPCNTEQQRLYYSGKKNDTGSKTMYWLIYYARYVFLARLLKVKGTTKNWLMKQITLYLMAVNYAKTWVFKASRSKM